MTEESNGRGPINGGGKNANYGTSPVFIRPRRDPGSIGIPLSDGMHGELGRHLDSRFRDLRLASMAGRARRVPM